MLNRHLRTKFGLWCVFVMGSNPSECCNWERTQMHDPAQYNLFDVCGQQRPDRVTFPHLEFFPTTAVTQPLNQSVL